MCQVKKKKTSIKIMIVPVLIWKHFTLQGLVLKCNKLPYGMFCKKWKKKKFLSSW